jgi:hypothetical protein
VKNDEMIDELARTWDEVVPLLGPRVQRRLLDLVVELSDARDVPPRLMAREKIRELLVLGLPAGHPLVASGHRLSTAVAQASLDAVALLRSHAVDHEPWSAVDRILSAEWEMARELRVRGIDPDLPDLIRLDRPGGDCAVPMFQFDDDGQPREKVLAVNEILHAHADPWGVADWWLSRNVWLHHSPVDLLDDPAQDKLLAAAHAAVGCSR